MRARHRSLEALWVIGAVAFVLAVGGSRAWAFKLFFYASVERMAKAPHILVVDMPSPLGPFVASDPGGTFYEATVVRDLHGVLTPGAVVHVSMTTATPQGGTRYLLVGERGRDGTPPRCSFEWGLGVTEVPEGFDVSALGSGDLVAQITAVLTARRDELAARDPATLSEYESSQHGLLYHLLHDYRPRPRLPVTGSGNDL